MKILSVEGQCEQETMAQNEYLRKQLGELMKEKQKMHVSSTGFVHGEEDVVSDQEENQEEMEEEKKVRHPFVSNEEGQYHEDNEVNFDIPPRFDKHEDDEGACEAFVVILRSPQKPKLKQEEIVPKFEQHLTQEGYTCSQ